MSYITLLANEVEEKIKYVHGDNYDGGTEHGLINDNLSTNNYKYN